ncbi:hypothetical protein HOK51_03640 [Candidatus Woesearchaeota archaeon]|jgi:hypothetical protein|nr:hypothetical protein [Candidatus Woesearchaeota archaeon]MBT6518914.1 hypothetical protein [Candidatus Woesearchaeota archaeon]MBT7367582.1 hypothetical protein [Candidatus Woesearchaeota archaeon]
MQEPAKNTTQEKSPKDIINHLCFNVFYESTKKRLADILTQQKDDFEKKNEDFEKLDAKFKKRDESPWFYLYREFCEDSMRKWRTDHLHTKNELNRSKKQVEKYETTISNLDTTKKAFEDKHSVLEPTQLAKQVESYFQDDRFLTPDEICQLSDLSVRLESSMVAICSFDGLKRDKKYVLTNNSVYDSMVKSKQDIKQSKALLKKHKARVDELASQTTGDNAQEILDLAKEKAYHKSEITRLEGELSFSKRTFQTLNKKFQELFSQFNSDSSFFDELSESEFSELVEESNLEALNQTKQELLTKVHSVMFDYVKKYAVKKEDWPFTDELVKNGFAVVTIESSVSIGDYFKKVKDDQGQITEQEVKTSGVGFVPTKKFDELSKILDMDDNSYSEPYNNGSDGYSRKYTFAVKCENSSKFSNFITYVLSKHLQGKEVKVDEDSMRYSARLKLNNVRKRNYGY